MAGRTVEIEWQGRPAEAWSPATLTDRADEIAGLDRATVRATERAAAAVRGVERSAVGGAEALGRLLLRAEGLASSNIEGLRAPVEAVAVAELERDDAEPTAAWVADNLDVVHEAFDGPPGVLTIEQLHAWHERLMVHGSLPDALVGRFRDRQGWIGGTSPRNAIYVPPPPAEVPRLMADLVAFVNGDDVDAVTQAAVVHGQFETIHPYGDGNGRLGRILIGWVLVRRLGLEGAPPPVSVLLARDPGGYLSGLHTYRVGPLASWVRWLAGVIDRSATATVEVGERIEAVVASWDRALEDRRADAAARRALPVLAGEPVVHAGLLARRLDISERAALAALTELTALGIVETFIPPRQGPGRPRRWFVARAITGLIADWP